MKVFPEDREPSAVSQIFLKNRPQDLNLRFNPREPVVILNSSGYITNISISAMDALGSLERSNYRISIFQLVKELDVRGLDGSLLDEEKIEFQLDSIKKGHILAWSYNIKRLSGERAILSGFSSGMFDERNNLYGIAVFFIDLVRGDRILYGRDDCLERRGLLLEDTLKNIPMGALIINGRDNRISFINEEMVRIQHRLEKNLKGCGVGDTFDEAFPKLMMIAEHLINPEDDTPAINISRLSELYLDLDGEDTWWDLSAQPVLDCNRGRYCTLLLIRDVTDEILARKSKEQRVIQLDWLLDSITDGILVIDLNRNIIRTNKAYRRIMGISDGDSKERDPLIGGEMLCDMNGNPVDADKTPLERALNGESIINEEYCFERDGEDVHVLISASPSRDDSGKITMAVASVTEITNIRKMSKLKDEFLFTVTHELKTPITVLNGYLEVLKSFSKTREEALRKYIPADCFDMIAKSILNEDMLVINKLQEQIKNINRIISGLVDVARIQMDTIQLDLSLVNMSLLVDEIIEKVKLTGCRHRVINSTPEEETENLWVWGDPGRLEQVVTNLLNNAIKYSPGGKEIEFKVFAKGTEIITSVKDHGEGIDEEEKELLFTRFYRGKNCRNDSSDSLGLGLYICRNLVEKHGGRIWVESRKGEGSTFYFSIPSVSDPSAKARHQCREENLSGVC